GHLHLAGAPEDHRSHVRIRQPQHERTPAVDRPPVERARAARCREDRDLRASRRFMDTSPFACCVRRDPRLEAFYGRAPWKSQRARRAWEARTRFFVAASTAYVRVGKWEVRFPAGPPDKPAPAGAG